MSTAARVAAVALLATRGACSQNFTYNEPNEFNYSYPEGANWTHVPCDPSSYDACYVMTGSKGTHCIKSKADYGSKITGVCSCVYTYGLSAEGIPGCSKNDKRPHCLSGENACKTRTPLGFINISSSIALGITAMLYSLKAIKHLVSSHEFNVRSTILLSLFGWNSSLFLEFTYRMLIPMLKSTRHHILHTVASGGVTFSMPVALYAISYTYYKGSVLSKA